LARTLALIMTLTQSLILTFGLVTQQFEEELAAMEEELAESQDSPEDASADGDETQMTESRKGDGEGDQQVRGLQNLIQINMCINWL